MSFNGYYADEAMSERVYLWIKDIENQLSLKQKEIDLLEVALALACSQVISEEEIQKRDSYGYASCDFKYCYEQMVKAARETKQELLKLRGENEKVP